VDVKQKYRKIACITGASGMIGLYIARLALNAGYQVRVLSRKDSFPLKGAELFSGSLDDELLLKLMLEDADMLFHCAAELYDESRMHEVNVVATERIAKLAIDQSVGCFVHISSAGVIGITCTSWVDETTAYHPKNAYEVSKWQAEQQLFQLPKSNMRLCMLRPTNVIDDSRPGMLAMALRNGWKDKLLYFLKGGERAKDYIFLVTMKMRAILLVLFLRS